MSRARKDPRDKGYKSAVVVGRYVSGAVLVLRRFKIEEWEDAVEYAMQHHGKDHDGREFDDIFVERSRLPCPGVDEQYIPQPPFRFEHMRSVSFVYDACGREVASVYGPMGFRSHTVRGIAEGFKV